MKRAIFFSFVLCLLATSTPLFAQQHDRHWVGNTTYFWDSLYRHVTMAFDGDSISYEVGQPDPETVSLYESVAMSDATGNLQFYTNGNVVVSWDGHIMEGGKGFNEGSYNDDFGNWPGEPDTVNNIMYVPYTYQLIPDGYEEGVYYMLHSFVTSADMEPCSIEFASSKMQLSKIDMRLNYHGVSRNGSKNHQNFSTILICRIAELLSASIGGFPNSIHFRSFIPIFKNNE